MRNWQTDFAWQERFRFQLASIAGAYLFVPAPLDEDRHHNTDFMILGPREGTSPRIACRVRTYAYFVQYPDDFTIRCYRPSGVETELAKLLNGWGDYILYGFADQTGQKLIAWVLGDLDVFRRWYGAYTDTYDREPCTIQKNHDGSSRFLVCNIGDLPSAFVIARRDADGLALGERAIEVPA